MNKTLRLIPALLLFAVSFAQAQTINLTADVTQANGQATPTLTWSTTPAADSCDASGDWSGPRGPSGTETQPTTTQNVGYSLTCTWLGGSVTLTWQAPQFNVDGTPVTDLTSYDLYWGATLGGPYPNSVEILDPAATSYVVNNLTAGNWYFVITATNSIAVESDFSNEATRLVNDVQAVESITVTVNPQIDISGVNLQAT